MSVTTSAPCLELGPLDDPGPDYVLIQSADLLDDLTAPAEDESLVLSSGTSCDAVVNATIVSGSSTWQTLADVHLFRTAAESYQGDDITASTSVSSLAPPITTSGPADRRLLFLEVTVSNLTGDPIELLGLVDPGGIENAGGHIYRLPDGRQFGTVSELQELRGDIEHIALAPNATARLGLFFDPESSPDRSAGTLTARPAVLVRTRGEVYSLLLSRVSTSWGQDLP